MKFFLTQDEKELMKIYKARQRRLTEKERKKIEYIERFLRMRNDLIIAAIAVFASFVIFIIDARRTTMNIYEATKMAVKENKCITRTENVKSFKIKPKNEYRTCNVLRVDGSKLTEKWWKPTADDLTATDWIVTE